MKAQLVLKLVAQWLLCMTFCVAAIFGAWLAGADPSAWTFALGGWFSALLVAFVNWWKP